MGEEGCQVAGRMGSLCLICCSCVLTCQLGQSVDSSSNSQCSHSTTDRAAPATLWIFGSEGDNPSGPVVLYCEKATIKAFLPL